MRPTTSGACARMNGPRHGSCAKNPMLFVVIHRHSAVKLEKLCRNDKYALFRNKRFMLDEMTQRNASKFAIFYEYENPKMLFPFIILCNFIFSLINVPYMCFHIPKIWQISKHFFGG